VPARRELERAYAHDSAGREHEAVEHYRRAFELGVPEDELEGALVGFGSTLRNVGEVEESVRVLTDAVRRFPENTALRVFLAYALWSGDSRPDAMRALVDALYVGDTRPELARYERAIRGYAAEL
jgi:tetratricopeptide (TPR) repeat protein